MCNVHIEYLFYLPIFRKIERGVESIPSPGPRGTNKSLVLRGLRMISNATAERFHVNHVLWLGWRAELICLGFDRLLTRTEWKCFCHGT